MNTIDDSTAIALGWATFVGGVALYIWIAAALAALFRKSGEEGWKGWVPILNQVVLLQLGGLSGWLLLLLLVPVLGPIAVWVFQVVAAHRIGRAFGYGAGMTVLAALLFPIWASVIGFGSARWVGGEAVATGPVRASGPVRGEGAARGDDPLRSSAAAASATLSSPVVPERPAPPTGYAPVAPPPAYGRSGEPSAAPGVRASAPPPSAESGSPAATGWTPPPVPPVPPAPAAASAQSAETAPTPAGARRTPAPEWMPATSSSGAGWDAPPSEVTGEVTAAVPGAPAPVSAVPSAPPAPAPVPTSPAPTRAVPRSAASDDDLDADAPTEAPSFPPVTRVPGAATPSTAREPWAPARSPIPGDGEAFPDSSAAVSAIAGAPVAGSPRSARASVSALHPRPHIPDEDELDQTVVARRKRTAWSLVSLQGPPIPLQSDVVIVGRRPASDPAFPDAQLLAVDDETRTVSKTHARLELRDDRWYITDLDSTNGVLFTTLMGTEVAATPGVEMEAGERFFLGDAEFALTRNET